MNFINLFRQKTLFINNKRHLIVHGSHHKIGTNWFAKILRGLADEYKLKFQICMQEELQADTDIFLQNHSIIDFSKLSSYKGSHMIRDPRDVTISGYFYHLWTKEKWAHIPREKYGNRSYQEYLNSLDREEGIIVEMKRFASYDLKHMTQWDYNNPNIFEIRYEEIIENEKSIFYELFQHYGFKRSAIENVIKIVDKCSFKNVTKRKIGDIKDRSHLRSGETRQWENIFSERHKDYCKELLGDALIQLGYEKDRNW